MRVILAIGAPLEDIEFGCAETLALRAAKGDRVYLLVLTRGEAIIEILSKNIFLQRHCFCEC
jgi:LmbE family N-acetylglucosaminyl deacetylase